MSGSIEKIIQEIVQRRTDGEMVSSAEVLELYPDSPQLKQALAVLDRIQQAKQTASLPVAAPSLSAPAPPRVLRQTRRQKVKRERLLRWATNRRAPREKTTYCLMVGLPNDARQRFFQPIATIATPQLDSLPPGPSPPVSHSPTWVLCAAAPLAAK